MLLQKKDNKKDMDRAIVCRKGAKFVVSIALASIFRKWREAMDAFSRAFLISTTQINFNMVLSLQFYGSPLLSVCIVQCFA